MNDRYLKALWIIGTGLCTFLAISGVIASFVVRFQNPELTETQLFLRYWGLYAIVAIGVLWWVCFYKEKNLDK